MYKHSLSLIVIASVLAAGCAGTLAVREFSSEPNPVNAGQTAILTVTFNGPVEQVRSVMAVVREAQEVSYSLVNDGTNGDEKAGDNVWSITAPVPLEAQPGVYNLDFYVRDLEGNLIGRKGVELPASGVAGSIAVTIR